MLKDRQDAIASQIESLRPSPEGEHVEWGLGGLSGKGDAEIFRIVSNDTTGGVYNCYRQEMTLGAAVDLTDLDSTEIKVWNMAEENSTSHALAVSDMLIAWPIGIDGAPWVGRTAIQSSIQSGTDDIPWVSSQHASGLVTLTSPASVMVVTWKARGAAITPVNVIAAPVGLTPTTTWEITLAKSNTDTPPVTSPVMWMAK